MSKSNNDNKYLAKIYDLLSNEIEKKETVGYDPGKAATVYSALATLFAGFAFTAIVLVFGVEGVAVELAIMVFLLVFIGCLLSAVIFAITSGEKTIVLRTHSLIFLGGLILINAVKYMFYGIGLLIVSIDTFFLNVSFKWVFMVVVIITPMFLIFSLFDPYLMKKENGIDTLRDLIEKKTLEAFFFILIFLAFFGILVCYCFNYESVQAWQEENFTFFLSWLFPGLGVFYLGYIIILAVIATFKSSSGRTNFISLFMGFFYYLGCDILISLGLFFLIPLQNSYLENFTFDLGIWIKSGFWGFIAIVIIGALKLGYSLYQYISHKKKTEKNRL